MLAWLILTVPLVAWIGMLLASRPTREVLWITWWVTSLFIPHWTLYQFGALTITTRAVAQTFVLLVFLVQPGPGGLGFGGIVPMDVMQGLFVAAHLISEYKVGRVSTFLAPELLRIWLLPYLMGRFFFRDADDLRKSLPVFAKIGGAACIYAVVESVSKLNLINKALGKTFGLLESGEGYRMGLKRCQGAQDHPIFMGLVLLLMLPWAFEAARAAREGKGPKGWKHLPWMVGAALFGTVSRGAQISGMLTVAIAYFMENPKKRARLLVLGAAMGGGLFAAKEVVMSISAAMTNETAEDTKIIMINGEEEEYTGTRHRVLLFKAYAEYLDSAGLWGFGGAMRAVQLEEALALRFSSIDSTWVMLFLQRGYAGLFCLVGVLSLSVLNCLWVAWPMKKPHAAFCGAMFGAIASFAIALFTTWFSPDFGSFYLFTAGVCARLPFLKSAEPATAEQPVASRVVHNIPTRWSGLVPGHPPIRPSEAMR